MPPPMTMSPSTNVTAVAMASPAISPNSAKACLARFDIAGTLAVGDLADVLRLERVFNVARDLAVDPLDGAYRHAVLDDDVGHLLVFEAEGLDTRVVAAVELIVDHHTDAEARAEGVAYQVL